MANWYDRYISNPAKKAWHNVEDWYVGQEAFDNAKYLNPATPTGLQPPASASYTTPKGPSTILQPTVPETETPASKNPFAPTTQSIPFDQQLVNMYLDSYLNPDSVASQASASFNPALSAIAADKKLATKRTGEYRKSSKADYQALRQEYLSSKAKEAKQAATDMAKENQDMAKGKAATAQEYSKVQASQSSALAAAGLGGSAQVLAQQALENQSMQAQQDQMDFAKIDQSTRAENSAITQEYLSQAAINAIQAGNETDYALVTKLQDTLAGLSGQEAQLRSQAAQAALQAKMSQSDKNIGITQQLADLYFKQQGASGSGQQTTPGQGVLAASQYLYSTDLPKDKQQAIINEWRNSNVFNGTNDRSDNPAVQFNEAQAIAERLGVDPNVVVQFVTLANLKYEPPKVN